MRVMCVVHIAHVVVTGGWVLNGLYICWALLSSPHLLLSPWLCHLAHPFPPLPPPVLVQGGRWPTGLIGMWLCEVVVVVMLWTM